uniref:lipopolysaccharide-responsive and beige-like anchor protein isoform X2 n=1 Tax=Myxine glutinosa TaxID=7769 RepID=UPI003590263B
MAAAEEAAITEELQQHSEQGEEQRQDGRQVGVEGLQEEVEEAQEKEHTQGEDQKQGGEGDHKEGEEEDHKERGGDHKERGEGDHKERGEGDQKERGEGDHKERGEGDHKERGEGDQKERGEGDHKERGEGDHKERGEGDQKERGEGDQKERGEGDHKERGEGDHKERGEGDQKERGEGDHQEEDHKQEVDHKEGEDHKQEVDHKEGEEDHKQGKDHKEVGEEDHKQEVDHKEGEDHKQEVDHKEGEDHKQEGDHNKEGEDHKEGEEDHKQGEDHKEGGEGDHKERGEEDHKQEADHKQGGDHKEDHKQGEDHKEDHKQGEGKEEVPFEGVDPGRPIPSRFGGLRDRLESGSVCSREIVDEFLNLLVMGQFDLEANFVVADPESLRCLVEMLDLCEDECRAQLFGLFSALLRKSLQNLYISTEASLIALLLERLQAQDDVTAELLVGIVGVLSGYSITVKELKLVFSCLRGTNNQWPRHAVKLLSFLNHEPVHHGPDTFFSFPGGVASAIALPPIARWPYQKGFTFHTWFRMDSLHNINAEKAKPHLYCFQTSKGLGYSCYFMANYMVLTSLKAKGKVIDHCIPYDFQPKQWYMITIVYLYNRWRNSEINCFVNGKLISCGDMPWHVNTSNTFDRCFLGAADSSDTLRTFCGQIATVYLFSEALTPAEVASIYHLGPSYKNTFSCPAECDRHLPERQKQVLYSGQLTKTLAFAYNAKATDGQLCLESSPRYVPSVFIHSPHALMLQNVKAIVTHSIHAALHSIGGVQVLFPLFRQLDYVQPDTGCIDTGVCTTLISFLFDIMRSSAAMQEQMLTSKGFLVIGQLLEKSSKKHITPEVVQHLISFCRYLETIPTGSTFLKQLCDHLLFNPAIWIHADAAVQLTLYTFLSTEFVKNTTIYNQVRRVSTTLQLLHTIKYYYWLVDPTHRSGLSPKGLDGIRPSKRDLTSLRAFLILFLKQLMLKDGAVHSEELQAVLNYLLTIHEDDNLYDILQLLVALMSEQPSSITAFDQCNGICVIFKLLASSSDNIRVQALKVLGYFLHYLNPKRKAEVMNTHNLFNLLQERLSLHTNELSMTMYNVLFEVMTENLCTQVIHKKHPDPNSSVKIQNPLVLKVVANLLRNSSSGPDNIEVKKVFLSDMIKLFNNNRDNRRSLLQCSIWQDWMFSLMFLVPSTPDEKNITESIFSLLRMLMYHALKFEWGGWRVWVDTLSIAHAKVAYEAHAERLERMYTEMRAKEEANVESGPKSGQASVISGQDTTGQEAHIMEKDVCPSISGKEDAEQDVRIDVEHGGEMCDGRLGLAGNNEVVSQELKQPMEEKRRKECQEEQVQPDGVDYKKQENDEVDLGASGEHVLPNKADDENEYVLQKQDDGKVLMNSERGIVLRPNDIPQPQSISGERNADVKREGTLSSVQLETVKQSDDDATSKNKSTEGKSMNYSEETVVATAIVLVNEACNAAIGELEAPGEQYEGCQLAPTLQMKTPNNAQSSDEDKSGNLDSVIAAEDEEGNKDATQDNMTPKLEKEGFAACIQTNVSNTLPENVRSFAPGKRNTSAGVTFSAGTQAATFRVPEFVWSPIHQHLLADLLFALESEVHTWRSHTTKTLMDIVNTNENYIFVHNMLQVISHLMDNLLMASGGILPTLQGFVTPGHMEIVHTKDGLSPELLDNLLRRLLNLVDALVFASSLGFSDLESEKNMPAGGMLRQCLRLVSYMALRNCLECQQLEKAREIQRSDSSSFIPDKAPDGKSPVDSVTGGLSPVRDPDRLLQAMDIHRLRAVVYRDIEDSKQAQSLALSVVYFNSVLMVSKYRDILEPVRAVNGSNKSKGASCNTTPSALSTEKEQSIEKKMHGTASNEHPPSDDRTLYLPGNPTNMVEPARSQQTDTAVKLSSLDGVEETGGPDAMSQLLTTLSAEVTRAGAGTTYRGEDPGINMVEVSLDSPSASSPVLLAQLATTGAEKVSSWKRSGKEESHLVKQNESTSATTDGHVSSQSVGDGENIQSEKVSTKARSNSRLSQSSLRSSQDITQKLERALETSAQLLREIFVDFAPFLTRTLLGSHGQELLMQSSGQACIKTSTSVVELVMLLCSQEWQNSIQKHAGLAFIELINEGRLLSHAMKEHLVRVANEAAFILARQRAEDVSKHAEFESQCAQYTAARREDEKLCHHMIMSARRRDMNEASRILQQVFLSMSRQLGPWEASQRSCAFWRLDIWEDSLRRRRRLVPNPLGSAHPEATLRTAGEQDEAEVAREQAHQALQGHAKKLSRPGEVLGEDSLLAGTGDGDDETDAASQEIEVDMDSLAGPVVLSTPAHLVAFSLTLPGMLSVTNTELCFSVDEEDVAFKKLEPRILGYVNGLHGKWLFSDMRAIFSRHVLLQKTALEIFFGGHTSIMFNLPDEVTVKSLVNALPRVGVGSCYGIPQARRYSLASPRQLFNVSNITQRWQRREISNFQYLMFLNTISGRTYNDLNQYPVFPWVIANYESEELDLTLPSNFRDLSKPVGALNPQRAAVFAERYMSWDNSDVPAFHYGTHYSTAAFVLMWLLRVEPFTTFFLSIQEGHFDHADRTFSSVAKTWRNCQRDMSDVKELIPEFYYLPEMFVNVNGYNLGETEAGQVVSDVQLPPWAKSPHDFVRINRAALESEIVSCQLHQWIDLMFGYKQRGPEAIRALNVFYHLTYEGSINMAAIHDLVTREAVRTQVRSFGQTPSQLLVEPHPPRNSPMQLAPLMFKELGLQQEVVMVLKFPSNSPITHVAANTSPLSGTPTVITLTCSRLFALNKWNGVPSALEKPGASLEDTYLLPVEMDPLIEMGIQGQQRRQILDPMDFSVPTGPNSFVVTTNNRYILACGFWDRSVRVYNSDNGKLIQAVFGHWDVVTCLARSEERGRDGDCIVVSGSRDATVLLWPWNNRQSELGERHGQQRVPSAVLTGHETEVTCVAVCADLGLVLSGEAEGTCLLHTIAGELLRTLKTPEVHLRPQLMSLTVSGPLVVCYGQCLICCYSINGELLCQTNTEHSTKTLAVNHDGEYLLTGSDGGEVAVWRTWHLTLLHTFPMCDSAVRALALTQDQKVIIAGMATGSIVLFNINFNRWHHDYQETY